jgi:hypothetical protein
MLTCQGDLKDKTMKNVPSSGRLRVEVLALPDETLQTLKAHRFRTVQDILAFGVSDVASLCGMGGDGPQLIEAALNAPPEGLTLFSKTTPFRAANSFEQKILFGCSEEFLILPITSLRLSSRAVGILHRLRLQTISDILDYGLENLASLTKLGEVTSANIKNAILDMLDGESLNQQTKFPTLLHSLLQTTPDRREIIKARFGFDTGKGMTLPEVGHFLGMSMHQVGKILISELRKMILGRTGIAVYLLRQRVDVVLVRNGYIAAFEDILRNAFFQRCGWKHLSFVINLLCALFPKNYRIIEDHYLTSLSPEEVIKCTNRLSSAYKRFLEQMAAEAGSIEGFAPSFRYVLHCLQKNHKKKSPHREYDRKIRVSVSVHSDRNTPVNRMRAQDDST